MKKMISVWGSRGSGKTAFATYLAKTLYGLFHEEKRVAIVYTCNIIPDLSYLLPKSGKSNLRSIGAALSKPVAVKEDVLKSIVTFPGRKNFGVMGFIDGENPYTYPYFDEEKIKRFFGVLGDIVDYVIVDCQTDPGNVFTNASLQISDAIYYVANPDLKSLSWLGSCKNYDMKEKKGALKINVINSTASELLLPEPGRAQGDRKTVSVPYSKEVAVMFQRGELMDAGKDRNYNKTLTEAAHYILDDDREPAGTINVTTGKGMDDDKAGFETSREET